MKRIVLFLLAIVMGVSLFACGKNDKIANTTTSDDTAKIEDTADIEEPEMKTELLLTIGSTAVSVEWQDNPSVAALKELAKDKPLTISMSMYGGFEQVGSLGQNITRNDSQTTTQSGDIVLYSGNQIVIFYGSNSWAYTRLGHITDKNAEQMRELLANGDKEITIELK